MPEAKQEPVAPIVTKKEAKPLKSTPLDEVAKLEAVAIQSQNGTSLNAAERDTFMETYNKRALALYVSGFGLSPQAFESYLQKSLADDDSPLLLLDVGGYNGAAAGILNHNKTIEAFQIDRAPVIDQTADLPRERHIVGSVEDMSHIPDASFHFVMSFNCLEYTDCSKSLREIFRVLKPGGVAVLDIEFWNRPEPLDQIMRAELGSALQVRFGAIPGIPGTTPKIMSFAENYEKFKSSSNDKLALMLGVGSCFLIHKPGV